MSELHGAIRLCNEYLDIALCDRDGADGDKSTDDLFDFLRGAPKGTILGLCRCDELHTRKYPRYRCWLQRGGCPTWHLSFCVPTDRTPEEMKAQLAVLFEKNGWKVL